jgi:glycine C-acetyltransferase
MRTVSSLSGREIVIDGKTYLNLASNNYLGLAQDERLVRAAQAATEKYGAGAGSSRLVGGTLEMRVAAIR